MALKTLSFDDAQYSYDNMVDEAYEASEADQRQAEDIDELRQLGLLDDDYEVPSDVDWDMPF